jgi:hypothetical protein
MTRESGDRISLANVRFWHLADNPTAPAFVRYWSNSGQRARSASEAGCVPFLTITLHISITDMRNFALLVNSLGRGANSEWLHAEAIV